MMRSMGCALGCASLIALLVLGGVLAMAVVGAAGLYYLLPPVLRAPMIAWIEGDLPPDTDAPARLDTYARIPFDGYDGPMSFVCTPLAPAAEIHYLTDCFGTRRRGGYTHRGLDFGTTSGSTVLTPWGGKVVWAGENGPYGNLVVVENHGVQVWFAHNAAPLVRVGDIVQAGDPVAVSDNTGNSTGPHVHFEIRAREGDSVANYDPARFVWPTGQTCNWMALVPVGRNAPAHCRRP